MSLKNWKTLSKRHVSRFGKFVSLEEHRVQVSESVEIPDWMWVVTPDFVNVIAVTPEEEWIVFRQTKYAVGYFFDSLTLAPVGGMMEHGEDPLETAKRELLEETGLTAEDQNWVSLTPRGIATDANRGCGIGYLFLALDATHASPEISQNVVSDDLEVQEVVKMSTAELEEALLMGEFKVQSWAACIAMAILHFKRRSLRN